MAAALQALQETLENIQSVKSCKVVEEDGQIAQIYIEAELKAVDHDSRTQEIKGIVRSIVGAAAIHHDLELDYRKIKVIEYKPNDVETKQVHPRIQIVAAYQKRMPRRECIVELHCMNQHFCGTAPFGSSIPESVFCAFNSAFERMGFGILELEYIQILHNDFAQEQVILLKVQYKNPLGASRRLVGVAEVQEDLPLSVVKAALNAVNRLIVVQP